jgi:hypothetical protein
MKAEQIDKLYKQLTPQENAALAFEALNRHDYQELDVIEGAVEKRLYTLTDYKYRARYYDMMILSLWYGNIYWKFRAMFATAVHKSGTETQKQFAVDLGSMEIALAEVCTWLKVDLMAVKGLAQCADSPLISTEFMDAERVAYYTELFMGVIGDRGN